MGFVSTKWLYTYWDDLVQWLITVIMVNYAKCIHFYSTFQLSTSSPFTLQVLLCITSSFYSFIVSCCSLNLLPFNHKIIHKITIHKSHRILLISLQIMVKSFAKHLIIDLPYNLKKHIQYKHVWKLFEVSYLHQHTVIALYFLGRTEKLLNMSCVS